MKLAVGDTVGIFHDRMAELRITTLQKKTFSGVVQSVAGTSKLVVGQEYRHIPKKKIICNLTKGTWSILR